MFAPGAGDLVAEIMAERGVDIAIDHPVLTIRLSERL